MLRVSKHERLEVFLQERGFSPTFVLEGDLLILRLAADQQGKLLADEALRKDLVAQAQTLGFTRIVLELL